MGQSIVQVDAFTGQPFAGNPAGVCVLAGPAGEGWMQQVAAGDEPGRDRLPL